MILDKKALSNFKRGLDLHVLLIMEQEKVTKAAALAQAYHEGVEGRARRTAPPAPPAPPVVSDKK